MSEEQKASTWTRVLQALAVVVLAAGGGAGVNLTATPSGSATCAKCDSVGEEVDRLGQYLEKLSQQVEKVGEKSTKNSVLVRVVYDRIKFALAGAYPTFQPVAKAVGKRGHRAMPPPSGDEAVGASAHGLDLPEFENLHAAP